LVPRGSLAAIGTDNGFVAVDVIQVRSDNDRVRVHFNEETELVSPNALFGYE